MLRERQKQILMILYQTENYVTFQSIADKLQVSVKTVRNVVGEIKEYIRQQQAGELITKPRMGIRYQVREKQWEQLLGSFQEQKEITGSGNTDILHTLLLRLLKHRQVSITELARQLYVSRALVEKHYEDARVWLRRHRIIAAKKKGVGLEIDCSESDWRLAMWDFFREYKHFWGADEYQGMTALLDGFDLRGVTSAVASLEQTYGFRYSYEGNLKTSFLIALIVIRTRKKNYCEYIDGKECRTDSGFDAGQAVYLQEQLEGFYEQKLPPKELRFLEVVLGIAQIQEFTSEDAFIRYQNCHTELCILTIRFVRLVGEICSMELSQDTFLNEQLLLELKIIISRLKYGIRYRNPLLGQIKRKYPNIMAAAWAASMFFDKELGLSVYEDEVGVLALHIGGAIERGVYVVKACIVCDYGIGISQIVKEKIERAINDIRIVKVISYREVRQIRKIDCDFIISTLPDDDLERCSDKEVICVDHLLLAEDIVRIEEKMRHVRKQKIRKKEKSSDIQLTWQLFHEKFFYPHLQVKNKEELIEYLSLHLEIMGYVAEGFAASVMERERKTSTEVGSKTALPHGASRHVIRSAAAVAMLDEPILWHGDTKVDIVFLLAIGSDEPQVLQDKIIKFYKSFVVFLEEEERIRMLKDNRDFGTLTRLFAE